MANAAADVADLVAEVGSTCQLAEQVQHCSLDRHVVHRVGQASGIEISQNIVRGPEFIGLVGVHDGDGRSTHRQPAAAATRTKAAALLMYTSEATDWAACREMWNDPGPRLIGPVRSGCPCLAQLSSVRQALSAAILLSFSTTSRCHASSASMRMRACSATRSSATVWSGQAREW